MASQLSHHHGGPAGTSDRTLPALALRLRVLVTASMAGWGPPPSAAASCCIADPPSDGELTPREAHLRRVELLDDFHQDQEDFLVGKESLAAPAPRTQTEESGAVPLPADRDLAELYPPIYEAPEIQYRLFPAISRPLDMSPLAWSTEKATSLPMSMQQGKHRG